MVVLHLPHFVSKKVSVCLNSNLLSFGHLIDLSKVKFNNNSLLVILS